MNVLSLFDGISCGQLALQRARIKVDNYFASEIDEHAQKVTMANFPNTIQLGDICKIKGSDLPKIDLIIGGSPCQDISNLSQKGKGLDGEKSSLFHEYMRLLQECTPKWFLLENVSGKKIAIQQITSIIGVLPLSINSSLFSAQKRKRLYWTNIPIAELPNENETQLKDVLEDPPARSTILSEGRLNWLSSSSGVASIKKRFTSIGGGSLCA